VRGLDQHDPNPIKPIRIPHVHASPGFSAHRFIVKL
jgi:hypothetical protein